MFLTVTPNLCIERTALVENFTPGQVHRVPPERLQINAGGKGVNASRLATRLGCETLATGWVGRRQKEWITMLLRQEGVPFDLVETEADTRVCVNILDGCGGKTEIVEAGSPLHVADGTRLLEKFTELLPGASLAAICGSYPPAAPRGGAAPFEMHLTLMTRLAQASGTLVLLDGKGRPFEMAVRSNQPPWCIKPNLDEAAQLLHRTIHDVHDERRAVRDILRFGVEVVILSCGARGAYLGTAHGVWFFHSPPVAEVSPVGSGDALVGAFAAQYLESGDLVEAVRWGVAAGAANAAQTLSAFCSRGDVEALLPAVKVDRVQRTLPVHAR